MALTRMPTGTNSAAIDRVNDISAALPRCIDRQRRGEVERPDRHHVQHRGVSDWPSRCGSACCTRNTGPRRFTSYDLVQASGGHLSQRLCQRVGGVVDHHVDAAELVDRALRPARPGRPTSPQMGGNPDRLSPELAQVLRRLLAGVGLRLATTTRAPAGA